MNVHKQNTKKTQKKTQKKKNIKTGIVNNAFILLLNINKKIKKKVNN